MNLPSEVQVAAKGGTTNGTQNYFPAASTNLEVADAFRVPDRIVAPFEYHTMAGEDAKTFDSNNGSYGSSRRDRNKAQQVLGKNDGTSTGADRLGRDIIMRNEIERTRQESHEAGAQEGRRAARVEMEVEMQASLTRERERLLVVVKQFASAREQYFTGVEQEVVKLALGIAERVLHREAHIDPILLAGVVRVALEKMVDRSDVILRVSLTDVDAWKLVFHTVEQSERPQVIGDARLQRGDCVLDTKMGTVELGVSVQLEEIEKGFFDLLNRRPVQ